MIPFNLQEAGASGNLGNVTLTRLILASRRHYNNTITVAHISHSPIQHILWIVMCTLLGLWNSLDMQSREMHFATKCGLLNEHKVAYFTNIYIYYSYHHYYFFVYVLGECVWSVAGLCSLTRPESG